MKKTIGSQCSWRNDHMQNPGKKHTSTLVPARMHPRLLPFGLGINSQRYSSHTTPEEIEYNDNTFPYVRIKVSKLTHHSENSLQRSLQPSLSIYAIDQSTGECLSCSTNINKSKSFTASIVVSESDEVSHEWSSECTFTLDKNDAYSCKTMILFDMRETAKDLVNRPIAWAFFCPHRSLSNRDFYKDKPLHLQLQLFKWRNESWLIRKQANHYINKKASFIPASFLQFLIRRKKKYRSCMSINIDVDYEANVENKVLGLSKMVKEKPTFDVNPQEEIWTTLTRRSTENCSVPNVKLQTLESSDLGATSVQFSCDGCYLAVTILSKVNKQSSTLRSLLRIYCCSTCKLTLLKECQAHNGEVHTLKWSADDKFLLTCGKDGYLRLWNASSLIKTTYNENNVSHELFVLPSMNTVLCGTFLMLDMRRRHSLAVVLGNADGALKLWSPTTKGSMEILGERIHHEAPITSLDTTLSRVYTCDSVGVIRIWGSLSAGEKICNRNDRSAQNFLDDILPIRVIDIQLQNINELVCNNRSLFIMSDAGLNIYDLTTQRLVPITFVFDPPRESGQDLPKSGMAISPDGSLVASTNGSHVYVWGSCNGKLHAKHPLPVDYASMSMDEVMSCLHWNCTKNLIAFCQTGSNFPVLLFGKVR